MDENDRRSAAIGRLKEKRAFQQHLVAYVVVSGFLTVVWLISGMGYFWPIWVIGGWGVAVLMHAWSVFGRKPITEKDIQREMRRGDAG